MSSCCGTQEKEDHCHPSSNKTDYLFWGALSIVALGYLAHLIHLPFGDSFLGGKLKNFSHHNFELMNQMWIGIILGALAVGLLQYIPQAFIQRLMQSKNRLGGLFRATLAGVLLDLCSHGILMVGMKLYEKGLTLGQTMAFLIASPWNSFSLTLILVSLIGLKWTLLFILYSALIAMLSGFIFDVLVSKGILPENPAMQTKDKTIKEAPFWTSVPKSPAKFFKEVIWFGLKDSKSIIKWLFVGVILASLLREVFTVDQFQSFFGPDALGLVITLAVATIIEVCSEGAAPIASDILVTAKAPGNAFAFLMTGVSTDYTEIMAIKEKTKSWKIALFLPLITVPQIVFIAWIMNQT